MERLRPSVLGDGFEIVVGQEAVHDGLIAEVDGDGSLVSFGFYAQGQLQIGGAITPGEPRGHTIIHQIESFPTELSEQHGKMPLGLTADELFRAWLDALIARVRMAASDRKAIYCSFCAKAQNEVKKIIAGPSVYICDECVGLCNDIIAGGLIGASAR